MANCTTYIQEHFAFDTIVTDAGANVVADQANDTLTMTSTDNTVLITGIPGTDTVDFTAGSALPGVEVHLPFFVIATAVAIT